jgi:hypothetical protein
MASAKQHTEPRAPLFPTVPISSSNYDAVAINVGTSNKAVPPAPGLERQQPTFPKKPQRKTGN